MSTNIEWTDVTDNIIAAVGGGWWCRKISPGCAHCYAETLNQNSFFKGNKLKYAGEPPPLFLRKDVCDGWARQRVPKRHFVASMTDIFGDWVPQEWIFYFLDAMAAAQLQTFQVLTKRPGIARGAIMAWLLERGLTCLPANIWLGTSVENQGTAEERIPVLLEIPAAVRFLSCEPLLGPVNLRRVDDRDNNTCDALTGGWGIDGRGHTGPRDQRIHWVIVGGESGKRARTIDTLWARWLMEQCTDAGTPFFMKQMGGRHKPFRPIPDELMVREFPKVEVAA